MTHVTVSTELRLRSRVSETAIRSTLAGKVLGPADYDVALTGPTRILKPGGGTLCVYLPGAVAEHAGPGEIYDVLHGFRNTRTQNRGLASGSKRVRRGGPDTPARRTEALKIPSSIAGAIDPSGSSRQYCRLTAWTGRNLPEWEKLRPLLGTVAEEFAAHVPDRFAAQSAQAAKTEPAWVVPGTPFTTITVNNTYPTGVHTDKGDLDEGFSTIACLRRGEFDGGQLVFPAYRVAADMRNGDLLLMDAHEWHGNTAITCPCGNRLNGSCDTCGAERISVVSYYRTAMTLCGTPAEEQEKARAARGASDG
jgi:hypothetical protein